ncbi:MAG: saccharopine dehydrogenase C-terminal domain-containing protein [Myxococcota bacterium]
MDPREAGTIRVKVAVLGGGRVGATIAQDLADDFDVTVFDHDSDTIHRLRASGLRVEERDLSSEAAVRTAVADFDLVVGAISSVLGFQTLKAVLEAGKNYCDISFMAEDYRTLMPLAMERGVTAIVDCGVGPGMTNMFAGWAAEELTPCDRIEILVGGIPETRSWPFEYKVAFAPSDVIEEYTRPARFVCGGRMVVREALSDVERVEFERVGTLEAFNTDGLRSLLHTLDVPEMTEKTLRYPGHAEQMRVFREAGFFQEAPLRLGDVDVRPVSVTAALLFPHWSYEEGEVDLTLLRVTAEGGPEGRRERLRWELFDRYDETSHTRSMARTTGFPAAIMARFLAEGRFAKPGVFPPEIPAQVPGLLDAMLDAHAARGVHYRFTRSTRTERRSA